MISRGCAEIYAASPPLCRFFNFSPTVVVALPSEAKVTRSNRVGCATNICETSVVWAPPVRTALSKISLLPLNQINLHYVDHRLQIEFRNGNRAGRKILAHGPAEGFQRGRVDEVGWALVAAATALR
jgi:hypothetical protein